MECQVCFEHFDSINFVPKILVKCGHSFCKICLERLMYQRTFLNCPICRETSKIAKKDNIPTNYSLIEVIDNLGNMNKTKNILEKYKYFNDKNHKHINQVIVRNFEPKKLNLKKIIGDDYIYLEEFENNQNYSIFSNMTKRSRRYNFNPNSIFSLIFNEYSYSISIFRKSSKCKHSFSCFEKNLKTFFYSTCIALFIKFPFLRLMNCFFGSERSEKLTNLTQLCIIGLCTSMSFFKCMVSMYIDEILKFK
jgi:hypothetical protein